MVIIRNEFLTATILKKGAEVLSIENNETHYNYMWDKDPAIWNNTSPILFPTVGKSNNNKIKYHGNSYELLNHGLARHQIFNIKSISDSDVSFIFKSSDLENNKFPFEFIFIVKYELQDNSLITTYTVSNPSNMDKSYFSIGAHPAFRCPFDDNHSISDYYLEFSEDTDLTRHELTEEATYTGKTSIFSLENKKIDLAKTNIADTLVFSNFKSNFISLCEKDSDKKITCSLSGFPYLAFWKKEEGNFVCIEPWYGKSDDVDFNGEFYEKKDIIILNPNNKWQLSYTTKLF